MTKHNHINHLIIDNMDVWASAIKRKSSAGRGSSKKIELYGIKKLRELILELAVRGKLVAQDASDEPASVLLERIATKKAELFSQGLLKPTKKTVVHDAVISADKLPINWIAADFGDITFNLDAKRIPLSVGERRNRQGDYDYYGASGVIDKVDDYLFDKALLLIGEDGANLINRSTPIAFIARGKYWVNNHAHVVDGISEPFLQYLCLYINSISLLPYITGMAQPKMNQAKMNSILVLLPPESEQHRIVAKVDELMTLCDQLEAQTEYSLDAHQTLVTVLLDTLVNSQNAEKLAENWMRISDHFDTLFTTEQSIDQLKQTILQLAVMGKLVEQASREARNSPNYEPASVLLERIATEKEELVKQKKIKKQKPLPPITEDEKPFELPKGWEWVRFENIVEIQGGITKGRKLAGREVVKVPYLSVANVQRNYLDLNFLKEIEIPISEKEKYRVKKRDLLITEGGDWDKVGRTAIWSDELDYVGHQNHVFKARIFIEEQSEIWLEKYLNGPYARNYFAGSSKQTTNLASINKTQLRGCLIAIAPLEEQHRIVTKVDELMAICDQMKARLSDAQTTQLNLADALVEQTL